MEKITKGTILAEIVKDQKMADILTEHNLPCLTCPFGKLEMEKLKVGEVCQMYGIDIDKLLEDLNK